LFSFPGNLGLPSAGSLFFSSVRSFIRELHRRNRIDIVHAHAALPCGHAGALLSRELGIPFVVSVHGLDAFSTRQVHGYMGRRCEQLSKRVYENAQRVICVSDRVRREVLQGASGARTSVVYNGVDVSKFRVGTAPHEKPTILSVGNLIPTKGHELLVRAFAAITHGYPAVSLDIIGDGCERTRLQALAAKLNLPERV